MNWVYYKDEFDTGIDGIDDNISGVDINGDDWNTPENNTPIPGRFDTRDYRGINGTEGNGRGKGSRFPDTEDLNGNNNLETRNNYFTYSFSLDPDKENEHGFVTGKNGNWRQFRIPIRQPTDIVGAPDPTFQTIVNVRLRVSDIPRVDYEEAPRIKIATFDFVGNEWDQLGYKEYSEYNLPGGTLDADGNPVEPFKNDDDVFVVTTYNTEENAKDLGLEDSPDQYEGPDGVKGEKDRVTNTRSKEQSLVMRFAEGLPPNNIAEAKKTLFSKIKLTNYKRIKMFVYGSKGLIPGDNVILPEDPQEESDVEFYMRFGSDNNNYYEYGRNVYQLWEHNNINIDLAELAALSGPDNEIKRNGNEYLLAKGDKVSLNSIHYFIFGVRNKSINKKFKGEVWLNELRISDVRGEIATALRLKTNLKLADVMNLTAEWESKDADFHNISTQFGSGNTLERQNYTATFNFDKLLPATWGMSIPIDARGSFSRNVPKYLPVSDDLSGYRNNTFSKKIQSLLGLRDLPKDLKDKVSISETIGAGTTIRKKNKSKFWLSKYTVDQLVLDFDYSRSKSSSYIEKFKKTVSYKERYNFDIPFEKNNYFEPLFFVKDIPILDDMHATKLFYSPASIKLSLSVSDVTNQSQKRSEDAQINVSRNTGTTRNLAINYQLLQNLNLKYSRTHISDADFDSLSRLELYNSIVTKFDFGKETNVKQRFDATFKPEIFSWMTTEFSFGTDFSYQLLNNYKYIGAQNSVTKRFSSKISPDKLVNLIYSPKKEVKKKSRPRRGQRKTDDKKEEQQKDQEKEQEPQEKEEESALFAPLIFLYNAFDTWKSVRLTYTRSDGVSDNYLSAFPKWPYQFGFTQDPGVPQDSSLLADNIVLQRPAIKESNSLKLSTNIKIGKISTDFSHDYKRDLSITNDGESRSGSESITYLAFGKDPLKDFKGVTKDLKRFIPNWSVTIPEIEKWFFFSSFADKISVNHAHSGKYDVKKRGTSAGFEPQSQTFSNSWAPLFSLNIKTIWDVSTTIRMTENTNYSYRAGGDATRTESSSFSIDTKYSKSTGFEIPLPFWPFKGRKFKNEINFSALFDIGQNTTYLRRGEDGKFAEQTQNSSWKLRPSATYKFNTRVTGSMFFETGENKTKTTGTFSYTEFGINVNIAIRD